MKLSTMFLDEVGKAFVFKRIRPMLRQHFSKAGIDDVPYALFGILFWLTVMATGTIYVLKVYPWFLSSQLGIIELLFGVFVAWLLIHGTLVTLVILLIYSVLDFRIHARAAEMETKLQDYLQFVSENLKGGMSFEKALWSAVRPQFGVLAEEMRLAAKKVMTGSDIEDALTEFTRRYPSPLLSRSFELIIEGTKGGAEIADIIDRVCENLEELKELKGEIRATNLTYVIFISFVVMVVAPVLFALSLQFLSILNSFAERLAFTGGGGGSGGLSGLSAFNIGKSAIDKETFKQFSEAALIVTGTFAGMIISIIQQGNVRGGIRYIPFFVITSITLYLIFTAIGSALFGGLIT